MQAHASSLKDRIPPHNAEAEVATLGALLLDPEALDTVIRFLRADDFYQHANGRIFQAVANLSQRGGRPDLITLTDELRNEGELDACGGAGYISSLSSAVPTSANVEYYARIVRECSVRRKLIRIASQVTAEAYDDAHESRQVLEEAERLIFEITEDHETSGYKGAREIIPKTIEAIEKLYHTKDSFTGIPSGFYDLDVMLSGFQRSEYIIIGARPSVGKTAFALSIAANIAIRHKIPVGFFTLEMSDMALMQRLVASEARIDAQRMRTGLLKPSDFHSLTEAAGRIYEAPLFITDMPNMKLLDLRAQARRMVSKEGVRIIFVDYLTLVTAENQSLQRHEQIAEISRSIKALARELDVPIVVLSQVRRETEGKTPNLADIRESGSIEQDADVVIFLHRDRGIERNDDGQMNNIETECIIAKQRNGPVGSLKLAFLPSYTRFENISRDPN